MCTKNRFIDINGIAYGVKDINEKNVKFKRGFAYITNFKVGNQRLVLPYFGKTKMKRKHCGIYVEKNNDISIIRPLTKKKAKTYYEDRIYELTLSSIDKIIKTEGVKSAKDMDIILSDTDEIFSPPILDTDNGLQKLIKEALQIKKIGLKNYISRFDSSSDLNNSKRALMCHGKMSFEKFIKWCEILDLSFTVTVEDSEFSIQPMGKKKELTFKFNK